MTNPYGAPPQASTSQPFASWGLRVAATLIDAIPTVVVFFLAALLFGTAETSDGSSSFQLKGAGAALYYGLALIYFIANTVYLQGTTGQSIGKKAVGIAIYRAGTTQPIGAGLSFGRSLLHILDSLPCGLGYLWPLWDKENRTFADMIVSSRSYKV
ncbi:RDD family protein [Aeromicrobium chenweiae]|uniref:Uncharacterized protein n=1 Tax=Aeromicrobium chenweiae TaxID=2079793 RepID=A0A2S0WR19_9ACTN|nr:RDD family protein [Aeromicrobium chenweiae]AWB93757.1 hypothetical protein C3E78_16915 [Aeromicrobium chenweiae]TGN30394.1 RDD family protein [Aeromicrobium chenweiae]